ncbi:MAG: bifunctional riboflavin kinase/FAD synthetase [Candidatus Marinimicrobia bacterium]|nr:bifunctional riboflavin kinase/FAD synthetase [Candidatus Neomarinimicrobiota bacterium]
MVVFNGIDELDDDFKGVVVTLGVYDGLHHAHMDIINQVIAFADERKTRSMVITFKPHPQNVLNPSGPPVMQLTTASEKVAILDDSALDCILFLNVDQDLLNTDSEVFVKTMLVDKLNVSKVIVGHDYHFGKNRSGKAEQLQDYGKKYCFDVDIVGPILLKNEPIRSSVIRSLLAEGNVEKAARFLGRFYHLSGTVVHGSGRGKTLGFPTANIKPDSTDKMIPSDGIYLTECFTGKSRYFGICNIGVRKTFDEQNRIIEVYLMDVDAINLYGHKFEVKFLERLRDEIKFASSAELIAQMKKDERNCRARIKKYKV